VARTCSPHRLRSLPLNCRAVMTANMNDTCANVDANNGSQKFLVLPSTAANYTWSPSENGNYYFVCTVRPHQSILHTPLHPARSCATPYCPDSCVAPPPGKFRNVAPFR
jgi:hypothetical protein